MKINSSNPGAFGVVLLMVLFLGCDGSDVLQQKADEACRQGDYPLAIKLYSDALEGSRTGSPAMGEVYAGRGRAYLKAGDFGAAQADLSAAIELKPAARHYLDRSVARQELGEIAGAMTDLRSAIGLEAQHPEAHLRLCLLLVGNQGAEAALPTCLQAARLGQPLSDAVKPELEAALLRLAEAAYSSQDYQGFLDRHGELEALSPQAAAKAFPKSRLAQGHFLLGEQRRQNGDREAAVEQYAAAIGLDAKDLYRRKAVSTLVANAESSESGGDYGQAISYYERALELAGSAHARIDARLADARRLERCFSLKRSGDIALQRIDWQLVERADEILGPVNRGLTPSPEDLLFLQTNAEGLAISVTAMFEANQAYRNLMSANCPRELSGGALQSNIEMMTSWMIRAGEITKFLADRLKERGAS